MPSRSTESTLRNRLTPFFEINPCSQLRRARTRYQIIKPWDDPTIVFELAPRDKAVIDALNSVRLPPRFTALQHLDSRDVEFIFTALPIEPHLYTRRFEFRLRDHSYTCEFGAASPRLLVLAEASRPVEPPSDSSHRNLSSFYIYGHYQREHPDSEQAKTWKPVSFWIRSIDTDDDGLVDICRHMNFYMKYFDMGSPVVVIHEPTPTQEPAAAPTKPHTPIAAFPPIVTAMPLDPLLHRLWESGQEATDPFRRFLYRYQIIEYCAFYHLRDEILRSIRHSLLRPDLPSCADAVARQIFETMAEDRMDETQKVQQVVERHVEPSRLWASIESHLGFFAKDTEFDGGLRVLALAKANWQLDDFKAAWTPRFADALRVIRNGLVHARERRMTGIIAPTTANARLLEPWLSPLNVAAMDLMLYGQS